MLLRHCVRRAASRAACTAGNKSEISTAIIAITTSNSISVKPVRLRITALSLTIRGDLLLRRAFLAANDVLHAVVRHQIAFGDPLDLLVAIGALARLIEHGGGLAGRISGLAAAAAQGDARRERDKCRPEPAPQAALRSCCRIQ